jgi:xanthine dehydrogenase YagT iron-sulfur-binding subunit
VGEFVNYNPALLQTNKYQTNLMANENSIKDFKCPDETRRDFLKQSSLLTALAITPPTLLKAAVNDWDEKASAFFETVQVSLKINGKDHQLTVEPRVTLLDLLREQLALTGTKKGCDVGQCGACTVHVNGKRVLSCLSLAVMQEGKEITTIEGISDGEDLHPMQKAFIKHDGFQCGYCTPGQIMSAIACVKEGHATSDDDIREYMSGNICRCGAYANIVKAVASVGKGGANS